MSNDPHADLIYRWDLHGQQQQGIDHKILFDDETLRDGLQSPSANDPDLDVKIRLVQLMDDLGIHTANIGLPAAKFEVPSTGSITHTGCSPKRSCSTAGSRAAASSPTTREPGNKSVSPMLRRASTAVSAVVTSSPPLLVVTSCSASRRKRGRISSAAASSSNRARDSGETDIVGS